MKKWTPTVLGITLVAVMAASVSAANIDGTWINTASATWSDAATGNWNNGDVADGSGFTADFSTLDIAGTVTVSLGSARTIGNLIFGDTAPATASNWVLNNGGNAANILTLAGTTPTITVSPLVASQAINTTNSATISAKIEGTDGLVKAGNGILALTGANAYSGGTTVNAGYLRIGNATGLGTGSVSVAAGGIQLQGNVSVANTINMGGGSIYGYSGGTFSGAVNLLANTSATTNSNNNNALIFSGPLDLSTFTLNVGTTNGSPVNITGTVSGSGNIIKNNDGTLKLTNDNSAAFSGYTRLTRGGLAIGHDQALGIGTLDLLINNDTSGSVLSDSTTARSIANLVTIGGGNGNSIYNFGSATASLNGDLTFTGGLTLNATRRWRVYNTLTIDSVITGSNAFTMETASGTVVLTKANSYSGTTTVNSGTLQVNNITGSATGSSNVVIGIGGTLAGNGAISGTVTVNGILAPGNSIDSLDVGNTTFNASSFFNVELGAGISDLLNVTGNLTIISGATLNLLGTADGVTSYIIATYTGTLTGDFGAPVLPENYTIDYGSGSDSQITLIAIPEPTGIVLLAAGFGMILLRGRRS